VSVPEYTIAPSLLARTNLVFTTGRPFADHLASSMPLVLLNAPPELGRMKFHMLWHERAHASRQGKWLRALVRTVAAEIVRFNGLENDGHDTTGTPLQSMASAS
jgi:hypothetical protein